MNSSIQTEFKAESICSNICSGMYVHVGIQILMTAFRCTVHKYKLLEVLQYFHYYIITYFYFKNVLIYFMNYQKSF